MISSITSGYGIKTLGGIDVLPYVPNISSIPMTGVVRVNGSSLEAFTGASWVTIPFEPVRIELDDGVLEAVNWARKKMAEEERLEKLAAKVPAVADLKSQLEMMIALTKDY